MRPGPLERLWQVQRRSGVCTVALVPAESKYKAMESLIPTFLLLQRSQSTKMHFTEISI